MLNAFIRVEIYLYKLCSVNDYDDGDGNGNSNSDEGDGVYDGDEMKRN